MTGRAEKQKRREDPITNDVRSFRFNFCFQYIMADLSALRGRKASMKVLLTGRATQGGGWSLMPK